MMIYWSYTNAQILKIGLYIKDHLALCLPGMAWERTVFEERFALLRCYMLPRFNRYFPIRKHLDNEIAAVLTFAGTTVLALVIWMAEISTSEERPGLVITTMLWFLDVTLIVYSYYLVRKGSRNLIPMI
jgi:hypothetical protein